MTRMTATQAKKLVKNSNIKTKAMLSQLGSVGEETLARHFQVNKINFVREYEFNPMSKHRADFYIPAYNLLVEVEGGTRGKSRHTTHKGYSEDLKKYNMAQILGYARLAYTTEQVNNGSAIENILLFVMSHNLRKTEPQPKKQPVQIDTGVPDAILEAQKYRPEYQGAN